MWASAYSRSGRDRVGKTKGEMGMTWGKLLRAVGTYAVVGAFALASLSNYIDQVLNYLD